jgi:hypothetical protein
MVANYLRLWQACEFFIYLSCKSATACQLVHRCCKVRQRAIIDAASVTATQVVSAIIHARAWLAFQPLCNAGALVTEHANVAFLMTCTTEDLNEVLLFGAGAGLIFNEVLVDEWCVGGFAIVAKTLAIVLARGPWQAI